MKQIRPHYCIYAHLPRYVNSYIAVRVYTSDAGDMRAFWAERLAFLVTLYNKTSFVPIYQTVNYF